MRRAGEEQESPPRRGALPYELAIRLVEEALRRYGIAYTMVGGFSFYDRSEIKDLLSYLKLVQNPEWLLDCAGTVNQYTVTRHRQDDDGGVGAAQSRDRMSTWKALERALKDQLLSTRPASRWIRFAG